jgi:hypothetical protein
MDLVENVGQLKRRPVGPSENCTSRLAKLSPTPFQSLGVTVHDSYSGMVTDTETTSTNTTANAGANSEAQMPTAKQ